MPSEAMRNSGRIVTEGNGASFVLEQGFGRARRLRNATPSVSDFGLKRRPPAEGDTRRCLGIRVALDPGSPLPRRLS